jgi:hypothetical protein
LNVAINFKTASMSSIGNDLAKIRKHLGYSIEDIQQATKIPLTTLQSIEDNSIFESKDEIKTYVRSFTRSYGRALKLDDDLVVQALDQEEIGSYDHHLLQDFPELQPEPKKPEPSSGQKKPDDDTGEPSGTGQPGGLPKSRFTLDTDDKSEDESGDEDEKPDDKPQAKPISAAQEKAKASPPSPSEPKEPASEAAKPDRVNPTPEPSVRNVNWADMGHRFSAANDKSPAWIIGAGAVVIIVVLIAWFLFQNDFFMSDDVPVGDSRVPVPEETLTDQEGADLALDVLDSPRGGEPAPQGLQDTLHLTVYAATGILDPVRVWSDLKPRIDPYWMEQGIAFHFEFADTIRVRGQYSRMLLFLNGNRIDDFRSLHFNPDENAVELTRELFEDDPRWATPVPLELPPNVAEPDSVADRPSFF